MDTKILILQIAFWYCVFCTIHSLIVYFLTNSFKENNIWTFLYILFSLFTFGNTISVITFDNYEECVKLKQLTYKDAAGFKYKWISSDDFNCWIQYMQAHNAVDDITALQQPDKYLEVLGKYTKNQVLEVHQIRKTFYIGYALEEN